MTTPEDDHVPDPDAIAAHLVDHFGTVDAADPTRRRAALLDALTCPDPQLVATTLYSLLLGRPVDSTSDAITELERGLHPARLAFDLLRSEESSRRPVPGRAELFELVVNELIAASFGVPRDVAPMELYIDPDAAFVLAAFRVAKGAPPTREQLAVALQRVAAGKGRETLLASLWDDPRTARRLFGPRRSSLRRVFIRRRRGIAVLRAHVLAAEPSVSAVLGRLSVQVVGTIHAEDGGVDGEDLLLVRVNEVASGLRRLLSKPTEW